MVLLVFFGNIASPIAPDPVKTLTDMPDMPILSSHPA